MIYGSRVNMGLKSFLFLLFCTVRDIAAGNRVVGCTIRGQWTDQDTYGSTQRFLQVAAVVSVLHHPISITRLMLTSPLSPGSAVITD